MNVMIIYYDLILEKEVLKPAAMFCIFSKHDTFSNLL
jgi:hypothetical protein